MLHHDLFMRVEDSIKITKLHRKGKTTVRLSTSCPPNTKSATAPKCNQELTGVSLKTLLFLSIQIVQTVACSHIFHKRLCHLVM